MSATRSVRCNGVAGNFISLLKYGLLLMALLNTSFVTAETCDYLPETKRPTWVGGQNTDAQFLQGVGSVNRDGLNWTSMRSAARQEALKSLASSIVVKVKTEDTLSLSKTQGGTDAGVSTQFESISSLTSSLTLNDVNVSEQWLDRSSCTLWTLVRLDRKKVAAIIADAELSQLLSEAENRSIDFAQRNQAYQQAVNMAENLSVDLRELKSFAQFESLKGRMSSEGVRQLSSAEELAGIQQLTNAGGDSARQAYRSLQELLSRSLFESASDATAEPAYYYAAQLEIERGNGCVAEKHLQKIVVESSFDYWQQRAKNLVGGVSCEKQGLASSDRLRKLLGGDKVQTACFYRVGTEPKPWLKACADIAEQLRKISVLPQRKRLINDEGFVDRVNVDIEKAALDGKSAIWLLADGEVVERANRSDSSKTDYRYVGHIYTFIIKDQQLVFEDEYAAQTGWNPVSENLMMDILAINVLKRFNKMLEQ